MPLASELREYISGCFTGIWIQSHEHEDALTEIAQLCRQEEWRLATWDIETGLNIPGQENTEAGGADPLAAIRAVNTPIGISLGRIARVIVSANSSKTAPASNVTGISFRWSGPVINRIR